MTGRFETREEREREMGRVRARKRVREREVGRVREREMGRERVVSDRQTK